MAATGNAIASRASAPGSGTGIKSLKITESLFVPVPYWTRNEPESPVSVRRPPLATLVKLPLKKLLSLVVKIVNVSPLSA